MSALRRRFQLEWRGVGEAQRGTLHLSKAVATRGGSDPLLLFLECLSGVKSMLTFHSKRLCFHTKSQPRVLTVLTV